jgi:hypothetical protein
MKSKTSLIETIQLGLSQIGEVGFFVRADGPN